MTLDFTYRIYWHLLTKLIEADYQLGSFSEFLKGNVDNAKWVILRHDVDRHPEHALKMAKLENDLGINASYYFRTVIKSFDEAVVKAIAALGHEIGYHYEDVATAEGDLASAIVSFRTNLQWFRKYYPVSTIAMHGSPLSKWDNRMLWNEYDYKEFGIIAEPYLDLNFDEILYITDASRRWNDDGVTVRDKVRSTFDFNIKQTHDIIKLMNTNSLPHKIMLNIHPHNWSDQLGEWCKIYMQQEMKNIIKWLIIKNDNRN